MAFFIKSKDTILAQAIRKLSTQTPITSYAPGSIARALTEVITTEIGDLYRAVNFNMSLNVISTAQGLGLDYIGTLYGVTRKTLSDIATIDATLGVFYFYIDSPITNSILIPLGTRIYTDVDTYIGQQFVYATIQDTVIPAGRTRAFSSIRPLFADSVFTAGPGSLTVMDPNFVQPSNVTIKCTNPKPIVQQVGRESDDAFRTRIIKAVRTTAGGTLEAVRFAGLAVAGVRDITIRETPYGLGSFEALIVSEDQTAKASTIAGAVQAMKTVKPVGVRMFVREPDYLPLQVHASIILRQNANLNIGTITQKVQVGILRYINTLLVGTQFVYAQLVQAILDATDVVNDVTITSLAVNGSEVLRQNYIPDADQQIVPGEVLVSVANS